MSLKVLELFGGIGACSKALERLGIDYEIADYVEIDKYAVKSFNAMHGTNFEPQDITTWDKDIEVDLVMHGSPCQDFSLAGKNLGGDKDSGTRSSLMYETIRIVEKLKPRYVIWENVKNLLSKKHKHNFDAYLEVMDQLGYTNYYQVLNAKDYGIPQNRERVFTISIKKDIDKGFIFPPKQDLKLKLKDFLEDEVDEKYYLSDKKIEMISKWNCYEKPFEKVYGNNSVLGTLTTRSGAECGGLKVYSSDLEETTNLQEKSLHIRNNTKKGYLEATDGDGVDISGRMQWHRGTVQKQMIQTINTNQDYGVVVKDIRNMAVGGTKLQREVCNKAIEKKLVEPNDVIEYTYSNARLQEIDNNTIRKQNKADNQIMSTLVTKPDKLGVAVKSVYSDLEKQHLRIRKLTPKECWRLMGFDDSDFEKAAQVNSNSQLYKQAGNSIVVNVLEAILGNLLIDDENTLKNKGVF